MSEHRHVPTDDELLEAIRRIKNDATREFMLGEFNRIKRREAHIERSMAAIRSYYYFCVAVALGFAVACIWAVFSR